MGIFWRKGLRKRAEDLRCRRKREGEGKKGSGGGKEGKRGGRGRAGQRRGKRRGQGRGGQDREGVKEHSEERFKARRKTEEEGMRV